jgi:hypothetical protein
MIYAITGRPGAGKTAYSVMFPFVRAMTSGPRRGPAFRRTQVATNLTLHPDWAERLASAAPMRSKARRSWSAFDYRSRCLQFSDFAKLSDMGLACNVCGAEDEDCGHLRKEGRGVCIFDESSDPLNTRTHNVADGKRIDRDAKQSDAILTRLAQIDFLKQHRKEGWHVYLITQDLKMLDSHIREMVEYEIELRNLKNLRLLGVPVGKMAGNLFTAIELWEGGPKGNMGSRMVNGRKLYRLRKVGKTLYDTHGKAHAFAGRQASIWLPRRELILERGESGAGPGLVPPRPSRLGVALDGTSGSSDRVLEQIPSSRGSVTP